jgi:argininosuccinate synthase
LRLYKGNAYVLGRSSETEKLYSAEEASMDSLTNFSPVDTSEFKKAPAAHWFSLLTYNN